MKDNVNKDVVIPINNVRINESIKSTSLTQKVIINVNKAMPIGKATVKSSLRIFIVQNYGIVNLCLLFEIISPDSSETN